VALEKLRSPRRSSLPEMSDQKKPSKPPSNFEGEASLSTPLRMLEHWGTELMDMSKFVARSCDVMTTSSGSFTCELITPRRGRRSGRSCPTDALP